MSALFFKRRLLLWILGITVLTVVLVITVVLLLLIAPTFRRRYAAWRERSQLQRRQYLMRKHNLIAAPSPADDIRSSHPPFTAVSPPIKSHTVSLASTSPQLSPPPEHLPSLAAASSKVVLDPSGSRRNHPLAASFRVT